ILSFGDQLFQESAEDSGALPFALGQRSLAEAEGLGNWEARHERKEERVEGAAKRHKRKLSLEEARARARTLRNPREWEKKWAPTDGRRWSVGRSRRPSLR